MPNQNLYDFEYVTGINGSYTDWNKMPVDEIVISPASIFDSELLITAKTDQ